MLLNDGVGALHPEHLSRVVKETGACFGICLDGDGDRGIFVDENGQVYDGDAVLTFFGLRMLASGKLAGSTVAATVMSNLGLEHALKARDIEFRRAMERLFPFPSLYHLSCYNCFVGVFRNLFWQILSRLLYNQLFVLFFP